MGKPVRKIVAAASNIAHIALENPKVTIKEPPMAKSTR